MRKMLGVVGVLVLAMSCGAFARESGPRTISVEEEARQKIKKGIKGCEKLIARNQRSIAVRAKMGEDAPNQKAAVERAQGRMAQLLLAQTKLLTGDTSTVLTMNVKHCEEELKRAEAAVVVAKKNLKAAKAKAKTAEEKKRKEKGK